MDDAAAAPEASAPSHLAQLLREMESMTHSQPATLAAAWLSLDRLATSAATVVAGVEDLDADPESPLRCWVGAFAEQCRDALDELAFLAPWTGGLSSPNSLGDLPELDDIPTLRELAALEARLLPVIEQRLGAATSAESAWLGDLQRHIITAGRHMRKRMESINELAQRCDALARMEYDFLYDKTRHLLTIGYNAGESRRDTSYYDLLASEARFSTFVAIAQGKNSSGELVCPGTFAHDRRWRTDPPFVERFDVRIPDAAAGDADVRTHAARRDL